MSNDYPKLWNKKWLVKQYTNRKRSIESIAKEVGCQWGTVKHALLKLKIKRRRYTFTKAALEARKKGAKSPKPRTGVTP